MNLLLPYQKETENLFRKQELCSILLATPSELYQRISAYNLICTSSKDKDPFISKKVNVLKDILSKKRQYISSSGILINTYPEKDMLEYKTLTMMLNQVDENSLLKIVNQWKNNSLNSNNGSLIQNNFKSLLYLTMKIGNDIFPNYFTVPEYEKTPFLNKTISALKQNKAVEISSNVFSNEECDKITIMKNAFERKVLLEMKNEQQDNLLKSNIFLYTTLYKGAEYSYKIENTMNIVESLNNKNLEKVIKGIPIDIFPTDLPEKIFYLYSQNEQDLNNILIKNNGSNDWDIIEKSLINATLTDSLRVEKKASLRKNIDSNSEKVKNIEIDRKSRSKFY